MKTTLTITLLALSMLSTAAMAGNNSSSASMQATFVVNEACATQSGAHTVVNCQFNTPYQVSDAVAVSSANAAHTQSAQAQIVTVTF